MCRKFNVRMYGSNEEAKGLSPEAQLRKAAESLPPKQGTLEAHHMLLRCPQKILLFFFKEKCLSRIDRGKEKQQA
jgi:hypothetical protein